GKLGDGFHPLTLNLFQVLARRRRHSVLLELSTAYQALVDEHEGRILGVVESALPLEDADREQIERAFSEGTGKQVHLESQVEKDLLGGVRVTLGGIRYDGSARARLESIRGRLSQARSGQSQF
ncbi:MAG: ATP synthase F1 subunit delta, partial [Planctomycetes bacterium]|nr:ATP synthase F1 subunit delta [Planctomycetota bacterium]